MPNSLRGPGKPKCEHCGSKHESSECILKPQTTGFMNQLLEHLTRPTPAPTCPKCGAPTLHGACLSSACVPIRDERLPEPRPTAEERKLKSAVAWQCSCGAHMNGVDAMREHKSKCSHWENSESKISGFGFGAKPSEKPEGVREFSLTKLKTQRFDADYSALEIVTTDSKEFARMMPYGTIHVVEYSALTAANERIVELEEHRKTLDAVIARQSDEKYAALAEVERLKEHLQVALDRFSGLDYGGPLGVFPCAMVDDLTVKLTLAREQLERIAGKSGGLSLNTRITGPEAMRIATETLASLGR